MQCAKQNVLANPQRTWHSSVNKGNIPVWIHSVLASVCLLPAAWVWGVKWDLYGDQMSKRVLMSNRGPLLSVMLSQTSVAMLSSSLVDLLGPSETCKLWSYGEVDIQTSNIYKLHVPANCWYSDDQSLYCYNGGFFCLQFYLQDTKSSNGTFVNNQRLSKGSEESLPRELYSNDLVQFGVDVMENARRGERCDLT